jgi:hypothetical protein
MGTSKELRRLIKALEAQGFTVRATRGQHYQVRNAEGELVATLAGTPSDGRSWKNALAALRRGGFKDR